MVTIVRMHNHSPIKLTVSKSNGSDNKLNSGIPWQFTDNTFSKRPTLFRMWYSSLPGYAQVV